MGLSWRPTMRGFLLFNLTALCLALEGTGRAASIDPILEWNAVVLQANAVDCASDGATTTRADPGRSHFAMTARAMYDALNSIENIGTLI